MEEVSILRGSHCRAKGAAPGFKFAVLGASGGIGQPLSLLMKMNPLVSVLHLYDVANTPGVTADISHMNTGAVVCCSTLYLFPVYAKLLYDISEN
jgi:malate dehydrogenase